MHILFVDDQPDTREVYAASFAIYGHTTRVAADGAAALVALESQTFEIAIVDLEMPDMDGLALTRRIRALPQGRLMPIIVFTAHDFSEELAQAAGADVLLRKPLLPRTMLQTVEHLVQPRA